MLSSPALCVYFVTFINFKYRAMYTLHCTVSKVPKCCIALHFFVLHYTILHKKCIKVLCTILQVIWLCNLRCSPPVFFVFVEHWIPNHYLQCITLQYITSCKSELHRNVVHSQDIYPLQCTAIYWWAEQSGSWSGFGGKARQKPWARGV